MNTTTHSLHNQISYRRKVIKAEGSLGLRTRLITAPWGLFFACVPCCAPSRLASILAPAQSLPETLYASKQTFIIIYYSWNGGRAEAVCAGGKGVRMR
jgi:hypothetical protein